MVQAESSGKTRFDIAEAQPIEATIYLWQNYYD